MHRCICAGKIEIQDSIDNKPMNDASAKNAEVRTCKVFMGATNLYVLSAGTGLISPALGSLTRLTLRLFLLVLR